jgi:ubiquinone/menaquinone biosynthesis C-methylase UbiE
MLVPAQEGYRRWAATYDEAPNPITWLLNRNLDAFAGETRGKRVIDVACGTGRWITRAGGFGIDLSQEMLVHCPGRVARADARQLPFRDESADVVVCTLALAYVAPVRAVMAEMQRIARPGGVVIAVDLHPRAMAAGWKRTFQSDGTTCEVENHAYSFEDLMVDGLTLEESHDLYFGEEERAIYERAGRPELFEIVRAIPALSMRRWRR